MKKRKHTKVKPVSPGKKAPPSGRVYSKYDQAYQSKPAEVKKRVTRNADRRKALADGRVSKGDGKDVHHTKGASGGRGSTRVVSASSNRARKPK